eukprot:TRINITY_DN14150_c0_g1_i1.p1 TRINITY_DN14150_c0_g1~~TRINITY_DN14150_c0_g1_i1.p1  ORF type:complete len:104 (-),score=26.74 TRINITY_DN14150_c0_g1_i1:71-358(-)
MGEVVDILEGAVIDFCSAKGTFSATSLENDEFQTRFAFELPYLVHKQLHHSPHRSLGQHEPLHQEDGVCCQGSPVIRATAIEKELADGVKNPSPP